MMNVSNNKSEKWRLQDRFEVKGQELSCNKGDCTIGAYVIEEIVEGSFTERTISPACATCKFAGVLTDIFNPDESRFIDGAPDDYKLAAARILKASGFHRGLMSVGRSETTRLIDEYPTE